MIKPKTIFNYLRYLFLVFLPILPLAFITEVVQADASSPRWFVFSVLTDILPAIIILIVIWWLAGRFARSVYDLNSIGQGVGFIRRHRFGQLGFRPFLMAEEGKITVDPDGIFARGGPAGLIIYVDTAAVLEKLGRLTRAVQGSQFNSLEPFERVYSVIDLRPKHWAYEVSAMTKDGIPITWEVEVHYQIDDGGQQQTDKRPYPFSQEAVFLAATGGWRREQAELQEMDWEGWVVVSQTQGTLRSMLARRSLDELIGLTGAEHLAAREAIRAELAEMLSQVTPKKGVKILEVELGNLRVDDKVTQQRIKNWQSRWQEWSTSELTADEARRIKEYEENKAEAQLRPLQSLVQELGNLKDSQDIDSLISLRLISALDRARLENEIFVPAEAFKTLAQFDRFLDSGHTPPEESSNRSGDNTASEQHPQEHYSEEAVPPSDEPQFIMRLPIISEIAAGKEKPAFDDIIGYLQQTGDMEFRTEGQVDEQLFGVDLLKGSKLTFQHEYNYFAVQISGDSMDKAGISSGDYVILRKSNLLSVRPDNSDIAAVVFQDETDNHKATLKRIFIERDDISARPIRIILCPESSNPEHHIRSFSPEAFARNSPDVAIVGIAIAVLKPFA
jgi:regulator of protease activity HflC (stomatin/prohibitin superfamily)